MRAHVLLAIVSACSPALVAADHGTPGKSFTFLQPPFTQELFGTHAIFAVGIAFAPDGDVLTANGRLSRYDRQGVEPNTHGDGLHPLTLLQASGFGAGIVNHPDGTPYANTGGGVTGRNVDTGALLRGPFGPGGNGLGIAVDTGSWRCPSRASPIRINSASPLPSWPSPRTSRRAKVEEARRSRMRKAWAPRPRACAQSASGAVTAACTT